MPTKSFRFELYIVHGHVKDVPVNYIDLINDLQNIRGYDYKVGDHHTAVGTARLVRNNTQLFLTIYTGFSEQSTLFFDLKSTKELRARTEPGRFAARKTYAMIDASKRLLAIQIKKGNLGPNSLSGLIERYLRTQPNSRFKELELSFVPVRDEEFLERLSEFERIKSATITLVRPNVDWTDEANKLSEVAAESNARTLDVTARSKRSKSLSKNDGIVGFIKSEARGLFQKIRIIGSLDETSGFITLDLNRHIQYSDVPLPVDENTGSPNDGQVRTKLSKILNDANEVERE